MKTQSKISNQKSAIELMSPAGSEAALAAAIAAGADSVYFGVGKLNMRARAANLTIEDLPNIASRCRDAGVKSYLTLNTIIYDDEIEELHALCDAAKAAGVSAVIATDIATIEYARSIGLEVHISVQANVTNFQALEFYARYADTVVLARELSLEQISNLWKKVQENDLRGPSGKLIRLELFAHGALCVAVSGKCYMSLSQYNNSANRGACFQPCRRAYRVTDEETGEELVIDNKYVMSPKDICTIQYLDKITAAGVSVLKIEGRGRSADYVATVTRVYREALDALAAGSYTPDKFEPWIAELGKVFNRGFWHGGYYCGKKLGEWSGAADSQATEQRDEIGILSNFFIKAGIAEFTLRRYPLKNGDTILIEGPTTGALRATVEGLRIAGEPSDSAQPNDVVTLALPEKARRQDKVFLITPRESI
ncbi:MAG: U32 family peptidase [Kiritimatiellales bacterium]|nr:U32 family peptidase [Kiritimatiellales bacterium]